DFAGEIVHPQKWPEDLDYAGKHVVVIGSGATAVTLVPALAKTAGHVTMLQRSPSYMANLPAIDPIAAQLRKRLPSGVSSEIVRVKNIAYTMFTYWLARSKPAKMTSLLRTDVEAALPAGYDFDTHFSPHYNPWDQRLCLVPDGDLFAAISNGSASMVTDQIEHFTPDGIALASGDRLHADIIITATGLRLQALGGMQLRVDGELVDIPSTVAYKGVMLAGVPNFALTIGYVNASWTLRSDLVARYVCRLLDFMRQIGAVACTPAPPTSSVRAPLLDLTSGYVTRGKDLMPKSGDEDPWQLHHNYLRDLRLLRHAPVADRALRFTKTSVGATWAAR
ncbi:MAG: NAD(P)/FAD-dependent oxidoreductase, partial [Antricoccus sp.]